MAKFEALPNELLLGVFEFLDTVHLIEAFYGLNSRFNQLLYDHFRDHQMNFQSITHNHFDIICQEYLPSLIDQIKSVHITNDKIFNLSELLLFSNHFTLDQFINLKSLSLSHIHCLDTINKIILQCRDLLHFNHLNIINCYTDNLSEEIIDINNNIWSLPKLTYFNLDNSTGDYSWLSNICFISLSIEYISIKNIDDYSTILHHLFKVTPRLRQISINGICWSKYKPKKNVSTSLISLKTSFVDDSNVYSMLNFIQGFLNLCELTLETRKIYMNGFQWEKFFINNLSNLKIFRLKMNENFSCSNDIEEQIECLVDSFRTPFWLEKHRWFIQCDYYYNKNGSGADVLYTLPYSFDEAVSFESKYSKSTDPNIENILLNDHVQFFDNNSIQIDSFNTLSLYTITFPNINQLKLVLPFIDTFNSNTFILNTKLISLNVTLNNTLAYDHLQILFDQFSELNSLKLNSFGESITKLFQLKRLLIRRLDLIIAEDYNRHFFSDTDCYQLINSSLGYQCEVLSIEIENPTSILDLIQGMFYLCSLTVRCKDTISIVEKSLTDNLPPSCSINTDPKDTSLIHIEIDREADRFSF